MYMIYTDMYLLHVKPTSHTHIYTYIYTHTRIHIYIIYIGIGLCVCMYGWFGLASKKETNNLIIYHSDSVFNTKLAIDLF